MRPPFSYYGGKTRVAAQIAALLPPHRHYVEPFAGSLAVLLAKRPSVMETVNDLDHDLVTFWRMLRERSEDLIRACSLTPHSRAELAAAWAPTSDELELARRVWVILSQGRGGVLRASKTGWRYFIAPRGSSIGLPGYLHAYVDRMATIAERLANVTLECMPALDLIAKYGAYDDEVLLYLDPPYLGEARGWGLNYRHEMKDAAAHRELAEAVHGAEASVLISGYASDLYDRELYPGWDRHTIATFSGNATTDQGRTEVVWSNRPLGRQLTLDLTAEVA